MRREHGFERRDAFALASVIVDFPDRPARPRRGRRRSSVRRRSSSLRVRGVRVQAAGPRRGADRRRDRALARRRRRRDRRGRAARRDRDRQDDGRDPVAGRGLVTRILVAEGDVVPVGTVLVVIGGDDCPTDARARSRQRQSAGTAVGSRRRRSCAASRRSSASTSRLSRRPARAGASRRTDVRRRRADSAGRGAPREGPRGPAADRRAPDPRAPRGAGRHLRRGVRLLERRPEAAAADRAARDRRVAKEFPELNARLEGDEIVYLDRYDLGIAVQTDAGPRRARRPRLRRARSVDELRADVDALAEKARAGTLAPEELRGSTFTVTSAGKLAGLFVTPLVNHPEVGDPRRAPHRAAPRRARRRGRRAADGEHQRHVRPPRRRRRARRAVHARVIERLQS